MHNILRFVFEGITNLSRCLYPHNFVIYEIIFGIIILVLTSLWWVPRHVLWRFGEQSGVDHLTHHHTIFLYLVSIFPPLMFHYLFIFISFASPLFFNCLFCFDSSLSLLLSICLLVLPLVGIQQGLYLYCFQYFVSCPLRNTFVETLVCIQHWIGVRCSGAAVYGPRTAGWGMVFEKKCVKWLESNLILLRASQSP